MTFVFNDQIPAAANSPSVDQNDMLINNQSTNSILAVDHFTFNDEFGGNHLQMHLPRYSTSSSIVNGTATQGSVLYSKAGTADAAHAQLFFKTPNNDLLISGVRAFAYANTTGGINGSQSMNVTSIVPGAPGVFAVTLTANAVTTTDFLILVSSQLTGVGQFSIGDYLITGIGTFTLNFSNLFIGAGLGPVTGTRGNPPNFSFIVIQI